MIKLLSLALAGILLLPSSVAGVTPHEVLLKLGQRVGSLTCHAGKRASVIKAVDENWTIALMPENGKVVMVEADEYGDVVMVYFGKVWLSGKDLLLEVQFKMTGEEASVRYPHPCDFLAPWEA